mmetsp:Transcript_5806/g.824  ORF Transcript_5806/g.824 Transcript_5806/m.824 type:complete len:121 (-) Transcript_5806:155-517(-)
MKILSGNNTQILQQISQEKNSELLALIYKKFEQLYNKNQDLESPFIVKFTLYLWLISQGEKIFIVKNLKVIFAKIVENVDVYTFFEKLMDNFSSKLSDKQVSSNFNQLLLNATKFNNLET